MSILIQKNKKQQLLSNDERAEIWKKPGPIDCSLAHRIFYEVDDGNFIANLKSFKWWSDASNGLLQIDKEKDYLADDQFSDAYEPLAGAYLGDDDYWQQHGRDQCGQEHQEISDLL